MIPLKDENPSRTFPGVTLTLVILNVAAFLYEASLPSYLAQELVLRRGLVPGAITHLPSLGPGAVAPGLASLITSMFLHGDLLHLGGNMLFLWIFANNVEDVLGHIRFVIFYLSCGLAAAAAQIAALPDSTVPVVGASGAIAGVLGAYMLLFPHARILTLVPLFFVTLVRLPAFVVLGMWFIFQVLHSVMAAGRGGGGVAWFAHVGGFVAGMLLLALFLPRRRRKPPRIEERGWA